MLLTGHRSSRQLAVSASLLLLPERRPGGVAPLVHGHPAPRRTGPVPRNAQGCLHAAPRQGWGRCGHSPCLVGGCYRKK